MATNSASSCFIKDGFAARYKLLRNGKRQIINFLLPGDIVGLPGSFLDRAAQSVIAITDMKLQICPLDAFVALCCRRPKFALALSWLAVQEAAIYAEHIINIGRRTPTERLAHFLLEIHSRLSHGGTRRRRGVRPAVHPGDDERRSRLERSASQSHPGAAARLRGMITVNERRVEFVDRKAMAFLAQFQPINPTRIPFPDEN